MNLYRFGDAPAIVYGSVVRNSAGKYSVPCDADKDLLFHSPVVTLVKPFTVGESDTLEVETTDEVVNGMSILRDAALGAAESNSESWFRGKQLTKEQLTNLWKDTLGKIWKIRCSVDEEEPFLASTIVASPLWRASDWKSVRGCCCWPV